MALCLPRKRRATSLATRPRTLSVASITNHSCFTSAGLALNVVVMSFLLIEGFGGLHVSPRTLALFHGLFFSDGRLLGGVWCFVAEPLNRCEAFDCTIFGCGVASFTRPPWAGATIRGCSVIDTPSTQATTPMCSNTSP